MRMLYKIRMSENRSIFHTYEMVKGDCHRKRNEPSLSQTLVNHKTHPLLAGEDNRPKFDSLKV